MKITEFINIYLLKNRKLVFFLLEKIKKCIPEKYLDKFYNQINCIDKIQWVLDVEIDLYLISKCQKPHLIDEWVKEKKITTVTIVDKSKKRYMLDFFVVNGRIFSIESNLPIRYLNINDIVSLDVVCN